MNTAEELFEGQAPLAAPPAAPAAPARRRRAREWLRAGLHALTGYLPMMLMGLLALATWWLVRSSPVPEPERPAGPPRGEPDYTMERFTVQRFRTDGTMRAQIEGDRMRHFPDADVLVVDNARVRSIEESGRVTVATARRAVAKGDGSELRLEGDARVRREAWEGEAPIEFRGERLVAWRQSQTVVADSPVTVTQGAAVLRADRARYDHASRVVELTGHVRATLPARQ